MSYHLIRISQEKIPNQPLTLQTKRRAQPPSVRHVVVLVPREEAVPSASTPWTAISSRAWPADLIAYRWDGRQSWYGLVERTEDAPWLVDCKWRMLIGSIAAGGECWLARLLRWRMLVGSFAEVEDADWLVCCGRRMLIGSSATGRECWLARLPGVDDADWLVCRGGECWLAGWRRWWIMIGGFKRWQVTGWSERQINDCLLLVVWALEWWLDDWLVRER